ncbi:MAG: alpha/beta hydrolase [Ruminococcus sp.]|nr:alpha/beta hydrolase [Ruminococcus sp.]
MKKALKVVGRIILVFLALELIAFIALFVFNRVMLKKERSILETPVGQLVEVDGNNMCVYTGGEGEHTIVFLSGWGVASPIMDLRSLYELLDDDYRIVVIERFGYGYSDNVDSERSFDTIIRQDRAALSAAGIDGSYILCPHSLSGLESLLWAQTYPEEV